MIECRKRQKVIKRPEGETRHRCMNKRSTLHGSEVKDECDTCPVRVATRKKLCPQREPPPISSEELMNVSDEKIREMIADAGLTVEESAEFPPLSLLMWTYKEALLKWQKAGRPKRSQEEVEHIHKTYCKPCEWYDNERCKGCGCKVTVGSIAIFNKLKMATEHCPKGNW